MCVWGWMGLSLSLSISLSLLTPPHTSSHLSICAIPREWERRGVTFLLIRETHRERERESERVCVRRRRGAGGYTRGRGGWGGEVNAYRDASYTRKRCPFIIL